MCTTGLKFCFCCKQILHSVDKLSHCINFEDCKFKRFYYVECFWHCGNCFFNCVDGTTCNDKKMPTTMEVSYKILKKKPIFSDTD